MATACTFTWLKDYAKGAIMLDTALFQIRIILKDNYDREEWMVLRHCLMRDPGCWHDVEKLFEAQLRIVESSTYFFVRLAQTVL